MSLRVAVVGAGTISGIHFDAIADQQARGLAELVGVCDVDAELAAATGQLWGVPSFTDHASLLRTLRPDVVHVCTPHDAHEPVAVDALAAGTHVLTEKPLAATTAQASRLADAAARAAERGIATGVCLQNRYNPTVVALARELTEGRHGAILGARAQVWWHRGTSYYSQAPWRGRWAQAGGGVLVNQAIHTLDLLTLLLGAPDRWSGHATRQEPIAGVEVEDTVQLRMWHPSPPGGDRADHPVSSALFATNAHWENSPIGLEVGTEAGLLRITVGDLVHVRPDGTTTVLATDITTRGPRAYWGASHGLLIADFYAHVTRLSGAGGDGGDGGSAEGGESDESGSGGDNGPGHDAAGAPGDARFWIDPSAALVSHRIARDVYARSGLIDPDEC